MAKQSLFSACKRVFRDGISGTYTVGNNDIFLELYSQQDIDNNNEIGNSSEENIVVVAGDTITIPEGYTLTPVQPKKSLVIICNTFVNNGTVSMYQKAPNVLPHDLFIISKQDAYNKDIIISAYANNAIPRTYTSGVDSLIGANGNNGTDRQCGSGGAGAYGWNDGGRYVGATGSGYAFGGGAGSGGVFFLSDSPDVDSIYPMHGGDGAPNNNQQGFNGGGVGNPVGNAKGKTTDYINNFGCGGRVIIFCNSFTNNGIITVNGTATKNYSTVQNFTSFGGASGAGAVDIFYTTLITEGTITANGGENFTVNHSGKYHTPGAGGNGSITLAPWFKPSILKPIEKYMSKENMVYFLTNYIQRLKQGED